MLKLNRNCSLDIFRYICALLVVAIHIHPFMDINHSIGYFTTQVITRIAVPFFFAVSGYYFIKILYTGGSVYKIVKKIFIVYAAWSLIYFFISSFNLISNDISLATIFKQYTVQFFISGAFYHLWFFPALFFSIFFVLVSYKLKLMKVLFVFSVIFYCMGCFGCSWYYIGNKIPIISYIINLPYFNIIRRILFMGLPFFMIGYLLNFIKNKYRDISNTKLLLVLSIFMICFFAEIFFVLEFNFERDIILTFFLYPLLISIMLLLINNPLIDKQNSAYRYRVMANFTYYVHPIIIILLSKFLNLINLNSKETVTYFTVCFITGTLGFIIVKMNNKYINKIVV